MFRIKGGKFHFWQWDLDQSLVVGPAVTEVHFAAEDGGAAVAEARTENGERVAPVPDSLLQKAGWMRVWLSDGKATVRGSDILVAKRPKPADYVLEEDEVRTWEQLSERIGALEKGSAGGMADWNADEGDPGHILGRTHWSEWSEQALVQELPLTFEGGVSLQQGTLPFLEGESYRIIWDGEEYTCVCSPWVFEGMDALAVGNAAMVGGSDTGEPFAVGSIDAMGMWGVFAADGLPHILTVIGRVETVHRLDEKYLPEKDLLLLAVSGVLSTKSFTISVSVGELSAAVGAGRRPCVRMTAEDSDAVLYLPMAAAQMMDGICAGAYFSAVFGGTEYQLAVSANSAGGYDCYYSEIAMRG